MISRRTRYRLEESVGLLASGVQHLVRFFVGFDTDIRPGDITEYNS